MSAMIEDMGPQRIKVIEAVRALKTALKCAICQGTLRPKPITTNCNHTFCAECFSEWKRISENQKCPECNTVLNRRKCKSSEKVSIYVAQYLRLAKEFQEELKGFNVPPEYAFYESQVPSYDYDTPVAATAVETVFPSSSRRYIRRAPETPKFSISADPPRKETSSGDSEPKEPTSKRRKLSMSPAEQHTLSSEQKPPSTSKSSRKSRERTTPPLVAVAVASPKNQEGGEVDVDSERKMLTATRPRARSSISSQKVPDQSEATVVDRTIPDGERASQKVGKSSKRKEYWTWEMVPANPENDQQADAQMGQASTEQVRPTRSSIRRSSTLLSPSGLKTIEEENDGRLHEIDAAQRSSGKTTDQPAFASQKRRRSSLKRAQNALDHGNDDDGQMPQLEAPLPTDTVEENVALPQESHGSVVQVAARQMEEAPELVAVPTQSVTVRCQTEAAVVDDACVQTVECETVAEAEEKKARLETKDTQTDDYPPGFEDASIDDEDAERQLENDMRMITDDKWVLELLNVRRRLMRMTRANVHRLMATYPGASRIAILFRIIPCFTDIINTDEALDQLNGIARDIYKTSSQALDRSLLKLEERPLFEKSANDSSTMDHIDDIDRVCAAEVPSQNMSLLHALDAGTNGAYDDVRKSAGSGSPSDRFINAASDENQQRCGTPPPSARKVTVVASPLTPSRRLLESNVNSLHTEKHEITGVADHHSDRTFKDRESNDSAYEKLPSTQPPASLPAHHDEETTRNSPDMFLSQSSPGAVDTEQLADDSLDGPNVDVLVQPPSPHPVHDGSSTTDGDQRLDPKQKTVDSTSIIGETPSSLLNDTPEISVRSQLAPDSYVGLEEEKNSGDEDATDDGAKRRDATIVSDVVGETPTQTTDFDLLCNSLVDDAKEATVVGAGSQPKVPMIVLISKKRSGDADMLSRFERLSGGKIEERWKQGVTHTVMMDTDTRFAAARTVKYVVSIASKAFVVNRKWVEDSLAIGEVQDPEKYEIVGDQVEECLYASRKSRLATTGLFDGFTFYLPGRFFGKICTAAVMTSILRMVGAEVVTMEADLPVGGIILFGAGAANTTSPKYAVDAEDARRYEHEFQKEVLAADFVLDSISDYKIAEDREQYRVYKGNEADDQMKTVFIV